MLETDQDNRITAKNIWGSQLIARETETDEYHYLYNGHGDVAALLNEKGETVKDYRYDVYGNAEVDPILAFNGQLNVEQWRQETEKIDNPFRYCGVYLDEETGNYYLRARYYDPSIQRFVNEDSYGVERGAAWNEHLYGYANNNPLRYVDPSGHLAATNDPLEKGVRVGLGSSGEVVKQVQKMLISAGYSLPKYGADGKFGQETLAAVNKYKKDHGLGNTGNSYGVVGNQTYNSLLKSSSKRKSTKNSSSSKNPQLRNGRVTTAGNKYKSVLVEEKQCWTYMTWLPDFFLEEDTFTASNAQGEIIDRHIKNRVYKSVPEDYVLTRKREGETKRSFDFRLVVLYIDFSRVVYYDFGPPKVPKNQRRE